MPGRGRQSAALNRMSLPGEPAGRGRKAGRHRMCHPRRSVRQRNEVKEPRSGARTASPCPAPDCVITCRLTDWHYTLRCHFFIAAQRKAELTEHHFRPACQPSGDGGEIIAARNRCIRQRLLQRRAQQRRTRTAAGQVNHIRLNLAGG